jgi:transposase
MKPNTLTPSQRAKIIALARDGLSYTWIAARFDVSHGHVGRLARRAGCPARPRGQGPGKLPDSMVDDIVSRFKAGQTTAYLAQRFAVHRTTIWRVLTRHGSNRTPS